MLGSGKAESDKSQADARRGKIGMPNCKKVSSHVTKHRQEIWVNINVRVGE